VGSCAGIFYSLDVETGKPQWKYDITSDGDQTSFHGNMLLTEETVLIGTDDGEGRLYAFNKKDGHVRWMFLAGRGISTDIVRDRESVYAVTLDDWIVCLDPETGKERWRLETGAEPTEHFSMGSTPALAQGTVFFGGLDGVVYALDASTGRVRWKTEVESQVATSTLMLGSAVVVGTEYAELYRLNAGTGVVEATAPLPIRARSHFVTMTPEGRFCVFLADTAWEGELAAFEPTLKMIWSTPAPDGTVFTSARPYLLGSRVLTGTKGGMVYAIDVSTGEVAWSLAVDEDRDWSEDGVRVCGVHESTLFVGTISGAVYAFAIGTQ
jgi:outer membrane protein assembly factor BamB